MGWGKFRLVSPSFKPHLGVRLRPIEADFHKSRGFGDFLRLGVSPLHQLVEDAAADSIIRWVLSEVQGGLRCRDPPCWNARS